MKSTAIASVTALTFSLSACASFTSQSGSAESSEVPETLEGPVTIEFWDRYCDDAVTSAVDRFNGEHKGQITVDHVCAGDDEDALSAKIRAAAAGGGLPDVAVASEPYVEQYHAAKLLVPVQPYLDSEKWAPSKEEIDDFYAGPLARTTAVGNGETTLTWPFGNTGNALYYNKDLLRRAGISQPPATWEQFHAASKSIKKRTGTPGWVIPPGDGADLIAVMWTYGEPWINKDGKTVNFDNEATVSILSDWKAQVDAGNAQIGDHEAAFLSGKVGMALASSGNASDFAGEIKDFDWDVAMLPHGRGHDPLTELYGSVTVMFAGDPQQQLASWLFMEYLASAENQSEMCPGQGCMPATQSSVNSEPIRAAAKEAPQYGSAITAIPEYAQLLPQAPGLVDVRDRIAGDVVTKVLNGDITPEQGAAELQASAQDAVDEAMK